MVNMTKMTEANKALFLELYNEGESDKSIAKTIGVSFYTIIHLRSRLGLESKCKRGVREMYEKIKLLHCDGLCDKEIAELVHKSRNRIAVIRHYILHLPPNKPLRAPHAPTKYIRKTLVSQHEFDLTRKRLACELKVLELADKSDIKYYKYQHRHTIITMPEKHNYLCTPTYTCRRCKQNDIYAHPIKLINIHKASVQLIVTTQLNDGKKNIEFNKELTGEYDIASYSMVSQHYCDDGYLGITDLNGILIEEEK